MSSINNPVKEVQPRSLGAPSERRSERSRMNNAMKGYLI